MYFPDFLTESDEAELLHVLAGLQFQAFDFHGYIARRRIVQFGWQYDFGSRKTAPAPPFPPFLSLLRGRVAQRAGVEPDEIVEAVITDYPPGAPIGWHRDVPQFEVVMGVSLGSACRMRFRPCHGEKKSVSTTLQPRSLYVMRGPARWQFQHSIPAVEMQRYSITFRTLRRGRRGQASQPAA